MDQLTFPSLADPPAILPPYQHYYYTYPVYHYPPSPPYFIPSPPLLHALPPPPPPLPPQVTIPRQQPLHTPLLSSPISPSSPPSPFSPAPPPDRNRVDIAKIESGQDTRTTIMLKNVPNKMSDKDLMRFIDAVCPRSYDFMYLRIDFTNKCNVGYAFVNFVRVQDLLTFAKAKLGHKWNMFNSEKVLQMSYANFQGKEALVEKFKNSCIMEEQESWRPKIFYSSGPNQGMPEPFPAPNNAQRAKRSWDQRGEGLHTSLRSHPSTAAHHHHHRATTTNTTMAPTAVAIAAGSGGYRRGPRSHA